MRNLGPRIYRVLDQKLGDLDTNGAAPSIDFTSKPWQKLRLEAVTMHSDHLRDDLAELEVLREVNYG